MLSVDIAPVSRELCCEAVDSNDEEFIVSDWDITPSCPPRVVWGLELPQTKTSRQNNHEVLTLVFTKNLVSTAGPSDSKVSKVTHFVD